MNNIVDQIIELKKKLGDLDFTQLKVSIEFPISDQLSISDNLHNKIKSLVFAELLSDHFKWSMPVISDILNQNPHTDNELYILEWIQIDYPEILEWYEYDLPLEK